MSSEDIDWNKFLFDSPNQNKNYRSSITVANSYCGNYNHEWDPMIIITKSENHNCHFDIHVGEKRKYETEGYINFMFSMNEQELLLLATKAIATLFHDKQKANKFIDTLLQKDPNLKQIVKNRVTRHRNQLLESKKRLEEKKRNEIVECDD